MNNFEWIKEQSTIDSLGHCLCDLYDGKIADCEKCPVSEKCSYGKNGYVQWLKEPHTEGKWRCLE